MPITSKAIKKEAIIRALASKDYETFISFTFPKYLMTNFHKSCIHIIQAFIDNKIKKLILSVPPQHGKSVLSTRQLVPILLGLDPSLKIAVVSYSQDRSRRFGRDIKRIITSPDYHKIFPCTHVPDKTDRRFVNSSDIVDILGGVDTGDLFLVGRGGGLTGESVDVLIMDDLYKNSEEANSPVIRQSVIDWYNLVGDSRLNNDSRQIIVFTRWHPEDLVGYIQKNNEYEILSSSKQIESADPDKWYCINFEAIQTQSKTEFDQRDIGMALFPEKHSRKKLEATRDRLLKTSPESWHSLYQGDPKPMSGLLYGSGFGEYQELPEITERITYIDTADTGDNFLCAVAGGIGADNYIYLLDVYYTIDPPEITEEETAEFLIRNKIDNCIIESNAGGRSFARNVEKYLMAKKSTISITPYYQKMNKESRIITNAAAVMRIVLMPIGWGAKFPLFYEAIMTFRKLYSANKLKDAPDALTGAYEHSGLADGSDDIAIGIA